MRRLRKTIVTGRLDAHECKKFEEFMSNRDWIWKLDFRDKNYRFGEVKGLDEQSLEETESFMKSQGLWYQVIVTLQKKKTTR